MKFINILFSFLLSLTVFGQQLDMRLMHDLAPRAIGPAGMSGRVTTIDVVNDNPSIIYVGTASGGLWKSESGGIDWQPIFDNQKVLSIGAVAIQQSNPDVIWAGTGEGNPRNSVSSGYGLYKSMDGGRTWKLMGLEKTRSIHRIIIDPTDPNTVYVGALGTIWGENPERGVYKTTDGGKTWNKILYVNEKAGVADMVMDPTNPNKIIAAMWEFRRWPYFFNSGGPGSGLYVTYDGGETWQQRTEKNGLPKGDLGRIGLAIAPSKPNVVYAIIEAKKNALYRSNDGGVSWKMINDRDEIGDRPFYYADLYVDSKNENRLYTLFSRVSMSEDGGRSFNVILPYYGDKAVHPDHHAFYIHPENPDFMINGNDGGMAITHDGGDTWRFVENLPLAQFYHINVDEMFPYHVYGGMQDNGSWRGPGFVLRAGGIRNGYWEELYFGDGFDVVPDPEEPGRYGYAMSQGGNVGRYDLLTKSSQSIRPVHPEGEYLRFNWNAAIAQDPHNPDALYYGSQFLHYSTDNGNSWKILSPDLTTNDPEKQKQDVSGGLTIDATNAENYTTITAIAPSPVDAKVIWVGTDDGNIQMTRDGGSNWTLLNSRVKGLPGNGWINQIRVSPSNAGEAYVVMNNYRQDDLTPYLYHTTDYGRSWTNIVENKGIWGYTLSFFQDEIEPRLMFLGTEFGLYISFDKGSSWNHWTEGYPNVSTIDMAYQKDQDDLVIGTFGRAAYVFDHLQPLREIAAEGLNSSFRLYEGGTGYLTTSGQAAGTRFAANAIYLGENRSDNLPIAMYIKKEAKEDTKPDAEEGDEQKKKNDTGKVKLYIKDGNDTIRTLEYTPDSTGIHVMYWGMERKGKPYPTRSTSNRDREPGGAPIMPGSYKVVASYNGITDSAMVTVKPDPRVSFDEEIELEIRKMYEETEALYGVSAEAVKQLVAAKKMIDVVTGRFPEEKTEDMKALIKEAGEVKKQLEEFIVAFIGPEEVKGIQRNPDELTRKIGAASSYTRNKAGRTDNFTTAYNEAKSLVNSKLMEINTYMEGDFADFRDRLMQTDLEYFKPYEPVEIEE